MTPGLVSVIIPVHNRAALLERAVDSVLAQTWRQFEILIVDDGSTDHTHATAVRLQAAHPAQVRVMRQANAGPGSARQRGVEHARGEFVQFLDSDDLLLPGKLAAQVSGLRQDRDAGISYGKTYFNLRGTRLAHPAQLSGERHRHIFPAVLGARLWETSTPLYRRSTLEAIGPWSNLRQLEDWEFDARAGAAGIQLHYCDEYLAEYMNHDEERLGSLWMRDDAGMRDRIAAHIAVHSHARAAGVGSEVPQMRRFVRSLFWMARTAGERGFDTEARQLLALARENAVEGRWQMRLYEWAAHLLGWNRLAAIAGVLRTRMPQP